MNKKLVILLLILLFGLGLRLFKLSTTSMYGDELTIVGDAYSLMHTGKDQLGEAFPLTFRMGAGRPAGYVYGSIPFVAIFGPNEIGVRMLSVISGVGFIYLIYLFGKKYFDEQVAIVAALLTSVSPLALNLSRGGFEANLGLFLATLGTYLFLDYKKRPINLIYTTLLWGLAVNTYPTYKVVLPIFLVPLIFLSGGFVQLFKTNKKTVIAAGFIAVLVLFGVLKQTFSGIAENRFKEINMFADAALREEIIVDVNYARSHTTLPGSISSLFHNKAISYSEVLIKNYLQNFSTEYLFLTGDGNPRHNMTASGILLWGEFITLFYGFYLLTKKDRQTASLLVCWLLIAPIATALVTGPHSLRNAFMLAPLVLISAYGLTSLYKNNRRAGLLVGFLLLAQFGLIYQQQVFLAPAKYARFWAYPAKAAVDYVNEQKSTYDFVFVSDRIDSVEFAYQVYSKIVPEDVIASNMEKVELGGFTFKNFDNVYIGQIPKEHVQSFLGSFNESVLYVGDWDENDSYLSDYDLVNSIDGTYAFVKKIY